MLDVKHNRSHTRGMNKLPLAKRVQILSMLVEGSPAVDQPRADVSLNTVYKPLIDAGKACAPSTMRRCAMWPRASPVR